MKTIRNTTRKPLRVPLPRGRFLVLGPAKTGQVSADATDHPSFRKLVEAGDLEVLGEGQQDVAANEPGGRPAHEATHGHPPTKIVMPKGNR